MRATGSPLKGWTRQLISSDNPSSLAYPDEAPLPYYVPDESTMQDRSHRVDYRLRIHLENVNVLLFLRTTPVGVAMP